MATADIILSTFKQAFPESQATVLTQVIMDLFGEAVKARDFNELKDIVKDLAESQKELAEVQKRTF